MPSRRHHHNLTFLGKVVGASLSLGITFLLIFTFWPAMEQHNGSDAHDLSIDLQQLKSLDNIFEQLKDIDQLNRRMTKLEKLSQDRATLQREAISAMQETRVRLRSLEDQLGMIRVSSDSTREATVEIRDMIRDHVIRDRTQLTPGEQEQRIVPGIIPGTVH